MQPMGCDQYSSFFCWLWEFLLLCVSYKLNAIGRHTEIQPAFQWILINSRIYKDPDSSETSDLFSDVEIVWKLMLWSTWGCGASLAPPLPSQSIGNSLISSTPSVSFFFVYSWEEKIQVVTLSSGKSCIKEAI